MCHFSLSADFFFSYFHFVSYNFPFTWNVHNLCGKHPFCLPAYLLAINSNVVSGSAIDIVTCDECIASFPPWFEMRGIFGLSKSAVYCCIIPCCLCWMVSSDISSISLFCICNYTFPRGFFSLFIHLLYLSACLLSPSSIPFYCFITFFLVLQIPSVISNSILKLCHRFSFSGSHALNLLLFSVYLPSYQPAQIPYPSAKCLISGVWLFTSSFHSL